MRHPKTGSGCTCCCSHDPVLYHPRRRAHAVQLQPQSAVLRDRRLRPTSSSSGLASPQAFFARLPFSLTLLTILMAHELGHYLACVYYSVDATLPFFLPSPTPFHRNLRRLHPHPLRHPREEAFSSTSASPDRWRASSSCPGARRGPRVLEGDSRHQQQGIIQLGAPGAPVDLQSTDLPRRPAGRYLSASGGARRLGRHVRYRAQSASGRPARWRPHRLRVARTLATNGSPTFLVALVPMGRSGAVGGSGPSLVLLRPQTPASLRLPPTIGNPPVRLGLVALCVFLLCFSLAPINE